MKDFEDKSVQLNVVAGPASAVLANMAARPTQHEGCFMVLDLRVQHPSGQVEPLAIRPAAVGTDGIGFSVRGFVLEQDENGDCPYAYAYISNGTGQLLIEPRS